MLLAGVFGGCFVRTIPGPLPTRLILADNVIWGGSVIDPEDNSSRAIHEFDEILVRNSRPSAHILPPVKPSVDGLAVARILE